MNAQMKFSDIIRYVLLGGFSIGYILLFAYLLDIDRITDYASNIIGFIKNSEAATLTLIILLFASFFTGLIIQSLRAMVEYYPSHWIISNSVKSWSMETSRKKFLYKINSILLYGSIFHECYKEKYGEKFHEDMPVWLYLTDNPYSTLNFVRGRLSKEVHDESSSLGESYYYHELFMGLSYGIILVPFVILLFSWNDITLSLYGLTICFLSFFIGIIILRFAAHLHARSYLRYLNSLYNLFDDFSSSRHPYFATRLPTIYVLIRTIYKEGRLEYLTKAVQSILDQNYPNKHIIILDDVPLEEGTESKGKTLITDIEQRLNEINGEKPAHIDDLKKITTYKIASTHLGASGASLDIRENFVSEANVRDIAVFLDDDDYFDRHDALMDIIIRMKSTNADICLTTFRNVSDMGCVLSNGGGKFHNSIVKNLAQSGRSEHYFEKLIFTDTLGWTKCYSYETMSKYVESIKSYDRNGLQPGDVRYDETPAFEDFPDFICYLYKNIKVCAVERPTHCYNNRPGSITGSRDLIAFVDRRNFLGYTLGLGKYLSRQDQDSSIAISAEDYSHLREFIAYKIGVICNIIMTKYESFSIKEFIALCTKSAADLNEAEISPLSQIGLLRDIIYAENGDELTALLKKFISEGALVLGNPDIKISADLYFEKINSAIRSHR